MVTLRFRDIALLFVSLASVTGCLGDPPVEKSNSNPLKNKDGGLAADANAGSGGHVGAGGSSSGSGGTTGNHRPDASSGGGGATSVDGSTCSGDDGGTCVLGGCEMGQLVCTDGTSHCVKTGNLRDGTSCSDGVDGGGVCNGGVCTACPTGSDCTPTGSCNKKTIACNTGAAVCADDGNVRDGNECGTNDYCSNGTCAPCIAGGSCQPSGASDNPCDKGKVSCTNGKLICTDQKTAAANGTPCGDNLVCSAGSCVPCVANAVCYPASPCDAGLTSCDTGVSVCVDQGPDPKLNGNFCPAPDNCHGVGICTAGACVPQSTKTCPAIDKCHKDGVCDPATGNCSTQLPVPDGTGCDDGNACTSKDVCSLGTCIGSQPTTCGLPSSGSCLTSGGCDPTTGQCVYPPKAEGASCGNASSGMTCTKGNCACPGSETLCANVCTDISSDPNNCGSCGSACSSPKVCNGAAGCGCPSATPTFCAATNQCVDFNSDPKNCGGCGHSCLGSSCAGGYCVPTTLCSDPNGKGVSLAVGLSGVYFTDGTSGRVNSCALPTGGISLLQGGLVDAEGVTFDPTNKTVYASDAKTSTIYILPTGGAGATEFGTGAPVPLGLATAQISTFVYWADQKGVGMADKTLGGSSGLRTWNSPLPAQSVVSDNNGHIWATAQGSSGVVAYCSSGDASTCEMFPFPYATNIHLVGSTPYVLTAGAGSTPGIYACPDSTDCPVPHTLLVNTSAVTTDFTSDAANIYYGTDSGIYKCAVGGCAGKPTLMTVVTVPVADIGIDGSYVYWLSTGGIVYKIPK